MDECVPTSSTGGVVIRDDEYNVPKNTINYELAKTVRESTASNQRDSMGNSPSITQPPQHSPTHRPLLLPNAPQPHGKSGSVPITISLSPPAEETNGQLVSREIWTGKAMARPNARSWKVRFSCIDEAGSSTLIACLVALVVLLAIIFFVLLFHNWNN